MKWKTKEIVVVAMISAVIGVLYTVMDYLYMPLYGVLGPIFMEVTFGIYLLSAALPAYIVRKPGFAIFGALVTASVNLLLGSSYGIQVVLAGLLQAVGMEIGYYIGGNHKGNIVNMAIGGVLASICVFARDYIVFGYSTLGMNVVVGILTVRILSSVIIGLILTKGITSGLVKTGVVKGFKCAE